MALSVHRIHRLRLLLFSMICAALPQSVAWAQRADVPLPDRWGDFRSTQIQGPRDRYGQRQWLVVTRNPRGLPCRNEQGLILATLAYGSVVDSDRNGRETESVEILGGRPWLWLRVTPMDMNEDVRAAEKRNHPLRCRVQAHASHVAPINPDTLELPGDETRF